MYKSAQNSKISYADNTPSREEVAASMVWERARTEFQKQTRVESILQAALKLLRKKPFHSITLSELAKDLSFTRANLYKYFESKEEVYLALLAERIADCGRNARLSLPTQQQIVQTGRLESFTEYWVEVMAEHSEMLTLLSVAGNILEKNCSDRVLLQSKLAMAEAVDRDFIFCLMTFFPGREYDEYHGLVSHLIILANGLHSICGLSQTQRDFLTQQGLGNLCLEFRSTYLGQVQLTAGAWIQATAS